MFINFKRQSMPDHLHEEPIIPPLDEERSAKFYNYSLVKKA